jgi:hypothetical protein
MGHYCGGSEVRIICAVGSSCGLLNQSHTGSAGLPVSFRFGSSKCGSANETNFGIGTLLWPLGVDAFSARPGFVGGSRFQARSGRSIRAHPGRHARVFMVPVIFCLCGGKDQRAGKCQHCCERNRCFHVRFLQRKRQLACSGTVPWVRGDGHEQAERDPTW